MTVDVDAISMDELRKLAEAEALTASTKTPEQIAAEQQAADDAAEAERLALETASDKGPFKFERTIDLGDGAGVQIFRGKGATREEAHEDLIDQLSEAQKHATKKIRDLSAAVKTAPVEKTFTPEEESVYSHELMNKPTEGFKKLFREMTGLDIEKFKTVQARTEKFLEAQSRKQVSDAFVAAHPDYVDNERNGKKLNKWLTLQNDFSLESFEKAYQDLHESGLLEVKGEEASDEQKKADAEAQRIAAAAEAASSQRTRRVSGLSTQRRVAVVPPAAPTEDEMYKMPLEKLRELANLQLAAH